MKFSRKKAKIVKSAVDSWIEKEVITPDLGQKLMSSLDVAGFDWKRLAKYCFWFAIVCIIIAVGAVIADEYLMELLARLLDAPDLVLFLASSAIAAFIYYLGVRRKKKFPEKVFSSEAIFFLGVLATAVAVGFFGRAFYLGDRHISLLILFSAIIYGLLGLWFPSKLVWIFSLLSLGSWMGTETGYLSGWGAYYLGMNYPLRFVLFGLMLSWASSVFKRGRLRQEFYGPTMAMGLLYLFISLWIMSIFGNYGDLEEWETVKQIELFHWSLLFGLAAVAAILHGLKTDDAMTRGFGITFLFINLYTRYFEYFWETTHKALFFGILGISFWVIGTRAERIWNLEDIKKKINPG